MAELTVRSGDAELAAQSFGDGGGEPIVLVHGAMASMLWWPEEFCERLAGAGRTVIRYDHRDTGRSTAYPPGKPGYTGEDLAADVVAIADAVGAERIHVAGFSMGGGIAQAVATGWPDRVASLTVLSSSPIAGGPDDLPPPTDGYMRHVESAGDLDYADRAALADFIVRDARALGGDGRTFDEEAVREFVERDIARTRSPASLANHELLGGDGPDADLGAIAVPALIVHGTSDPLLPIAHGEALAGLIPGARFLALEGAGHELHRDDWPQIVAAMHDVTA